MSIYYDIKEHLAVTNARSEYVTPAMEAADLLAVQLADLGAAMLLGNAKNAELRLTADGKQYSFNGDVPGAEYKQIIQAIQNTNDIDFTVVYSGYVGDFTFGLENYFRDLSGNEMEGMFLSLWENADCSDGEGIVSAYGKYNGTMYRGKLEFRDTEAFSEGEWYAGTFLILDSDMDEQTMTVTREFCQKLQTFINDDSGIYCDDGYFSYYMNNVTLHTTSDFEKLVSLYAEATQLPCPFTYMNEFVDLAGDDARIMKLDFDGDNLPHIKVAELR